MTVPPANLRSSPRKALEHDRAADGLSNAMKMGLRELRSGEQRKLVRIELRTRLESRARLRQYE